MTNAALAYGRKLFSIALVFNCLLTIVYATGLLSGVYVGHWRLYQPYLFNSEFLWVIIIVATLNLYPAMKIGRIKTGRLLFHHYVYGFIVLALAGAFLFLFTSVSLIGLFIENTNNLAINVGRFFVLGGLALVLDDFGDISNGTKITLDFFKAKAHRGSSIIHWAHCLLGLAALYVFLAVSIWLIVNPAGVTVANLIFVGSLLVTCLTAFWGIGDGMWSKLYHIHPSELGSHIN